MPLDAAGHLLLAGAHLRKAREKLDEQECWGRLATAWLKTRDAEEQVRQAMNLLKQEKEKP